MVGEQENVKQMLRFYSDSVGDWISCLDHCIKFIDLDGLVLGFQTEKMHTACLPL